MKYLDTLFYLTGAIVWSVITSIVSLFLFKLLWDYLGSGILTFRVVKAIKEAGGKPTFKQTLEFWNDNVWNSYDPSHHFYHTVKKSGKTVWMPWPWLSKRRRKDIEEDIESGGYV